MNRRDFLRRFLGTAAGAAVAHTLDLDKLLWLPGERTIFVPPVPALAFHPDAFAIAMGDLITFEGRFAVNPLTLRATKHLQVFIVTGVNRGTVSLHPR